MADYPYVLYDTAVFGTTAATETLLFQTAQGADSTHTEDYTNMRGAGSLPQTEKFHITNVHWFFDADLIQADLAALLKGSFFQIRLADRVIYWAPIQAHVRYAGVNAFYSQTSAATAAAMGFINDARPVDLNHDIPGGVKFAVRVKQVTALATASKNVRCLLFGTLTLPDA